MTTLLETRLGHIEGELGELVQPFVREVAAAASKDAVDPSFTDRFRHTAKRLLDLNDELHEDDFDPHALAEFRGIIIDTIKDVEEADPDRPLDTVDAILVHAEQLRHLIRDAMDGHVGGSGQSSAEVMQNLRRVLPSIGGVELAALLGRSQRQIQRWAHQTGEPSRRLELVARIAMLLRHSWTEEGVVAWFFRPRPDLDGKKPVDLLDEPGRELDLIAAARRGRAQHGS
jgi:hypothetical protein